MADVLEKCGVCGAMLDEEDLFCGNCGTEAPDRNRELSQGSFQATHNFECDSCGASMSYDASAQNLRCPFCGSEKLEARQETRMLAPQRVLPFGIGRGDAERIMRQWLGRGFFRPGDLAMRAAIDCITPVYVPFWVFSARTTTHWTADSSVVPPGARASWYPVFGTSAGEYRDLLIGGSGVLTMQETTEICPFELGRAVAPEEVDLTNAVYEQFRVHRKYARPLAQRGLEDLERKACQRFVPGQCRNMKVNVLLDGLASEPVLLPVWIMAYRYQDRVYRFLVNGSSGKATGTAPNDWKKMVLVGAAVVLGILLLLFLFAACAGLL